MLEDDVRTPCVDEGGFTHDNRDVPLVLDKVVDEALRARRVQLSLRPFGRPLWHPRGCAWHRPDRSWRANHRIATAARAIDLTDVRQRSYCHFLALCLGLEEVRKNRLGQMTIPDRCVVLFLAAAEKRINTDSNCIM